MYEIVDLSNEKNGYFTYQLKKQNQVILLLRAHREHDFDDSYILRIIDATPLTDISDIRTEWPVPYFMVSKLIKEFLKNNVEEDIFLVDAFDPRFMRIIEDFQFQLEFNNYFGSIEIDTLIDYLKTRTKTYALKNYYPVTEYNKVPLIKKTMHVYETLFHTDDKHKLPFSYWENQLMNDLDKLNSVVLYPTKTIRGYAYLYKNMFELDLGHIYYDSLDSKERVVSSLIASLQLLRKDVDEIFLNIRAKDIYTADLFKDLNKTDFFVQSIYKMAKK